MVHDCILRMYIFNHYLKKDLKEEMQSDVLIGRGSEFQSEQVFGTNELRYIQVSPAKRLTI